MLLEGTRLPRSCSGSNALGLTHYRTGKKPSESLEEVLLDEEIPLEKVDYGLISIADLPYVDYKLFMQYSLVDTLALYVLNAKISDIDDTYSISIENRVRFERARSQTTSIECLYRHLVKYDDTFGYILSNNRNRVDPPEREKIRGAFVSNPNLIKNCGEKLSWMLKPSNKLFRLVLDFDFSTMYPTLIRVFKVDLINFKGIIKISPAFTKNLEEIENSLKDDPKKQAIMNFFKLTKTAKESSDSDEEPEICIFMSTLLAKDWMNLGSRYSNLPSKEETITKLLAYKQTKKG